MDENRLPELPQEAFRPMIAQSVQLEQFLGEELTFCFRDLDGAHTFTTCYGDIYKRSMHCGTMSGFWNRCAISGS